MDMFYSEVVKQWDALVCREEKLEYHINDDDGCISTKLSSPWRVRICEWCYQVTDAYGIDRAVVSIALSYLDRFVSLLRQEANDYEYQLAAITCLYTAVKVHR
eukprot:scaffold6677_cov62-Alexandrium_tamarense.AAC.4